MAFEPPEVLPDGIPGELLDDEAAGIQPRPPKSFEANCAQKRVEKAQRRRRKAAGRRRRKAAREVELQTT